MGTVSGEGESSVKQCMVVNFCEGGGKPQLLATGKAYEIMITVTPLKSCSISLVRWCIIHHSFILFDGVDVMLLFYVHTRTTTNPSQL